LSPGSNDRPISQFRPHKPECELADKLDCGDGSDTQSGGGELGWVGAQYFGKAAEPLEKLCRQTFDLGPWVTCEQHQFEQLIVGQFFAPAARRIGAAVHDDSNTNALLWVQWRSCQSEEIYLRPSSSSQ